MTDPSFALPVILGIGAVLLLLALMWRYHPRVLALTTEIRGLREQLGREQEALDRSDHELERMQAEFNKASQTIARLQTTLDLERKAFEATGDLLLAKFHEGARADLELKQKAVEALVKPIRENLEKFTTQVQELEIKHTTAYETLTKQVSTLGSAAGDLVQVLRQPQQRGRWGEMQLDNVLQSAGLVEGLDYVKQPTTETGEGRLRPDVVVNLADGGQLVVDSKAPVDAFLNAYEATSAEERDAFLRDHVRLVKNHLAALSGKEYWKQFSPSPECVVMFVPVESFLTTALAHEPNLIRDSFDKRVVLASPITLLALLTAVASAWKQKRMEQQVEEIGRAGRDLYDRLATFAEHYIRVGKSLQAAADTYNSSIGSFERNLLPGARRIKELDERIDRALPQPEPVEFAPRPVRARELQPPEGDKG